jgi:hypothetical protein
MINFLNLLTHNKFVSNNIKKITQDRMQSMKTILRKIPDQVIRLSIVLVVLIFFFVLIRIILVPPDFGKYGHFRASAVNEIISQEILYAGQVVCFDCHGDLSEIKNSSYHADVACEACHGPSAAHTENPDSIKPQAPRERGYCPLCHEYLPARPTGFPQIVAASHNPMKACITCHDPHDPKPSETPKECHACHAEIARTKSVSHHVYISCVRCHETPEEHKISPRQVIPDKPISREFCGECHSEGSPDSKGIPKIDLISHYGRYVCWQCHYPHLPEAN